MEQADSQPFTDAQHAAIQRIVRNELERMLTGIAREIPSVVRKYAAKQPPSYRPIEPEAAQLFDDLRTFGAAPWLAAAIVSANPDLTMEELEDLVASERARGTPHPRRIMLRHLRESRVGKEYAQPTNEMSGPFFGDPNVVGPMT